MSTVQTVNRLFSVSPLIFFIVEYLSSLLNISIQIDTFIDHFKMINGYENKNNIFDFIIVGAGSSGCHLAYKLSEIYKVLLLDVGGTPSPLQNVPTLGFILNNQQPVDWAHRTLPQTHAAFGLNSKVANWPQGKALGGSSSMNGLIYLRGNIQGFDIVANKTDDPKWKMDNILRYFIATEDYKGWASTGHGHGGKMSIEKNKVQPFIWTLLEAGAELGFPTRDTNPYGPHENGIGLMELHTRNGRRADTYHEVIAPILSRKNLIIRKFSYVTKILMDGYTAKGVEYQRHERWFRVFATKEVILSAGSLNSPKLLMLSGIGPREHLDEVGIQTIVDLPVGQNLQDKYGAVVGPFLVDNGFSFNQYRDITFNDFASWIDYAKGEISNARVDATHAYTTSVAKRLGRSDAPDVHTYVLSMSADRNAESYFQKSFNFNPETAHHYGEADGKDSFMQLVCLSRPFGHGFVKLRDSNPFSSLIIDPKYLQDPRDVEALTEGIRFAVSLVDDAKAFRKINGHLIKEGIPGCRHFHFKSPKYFECLARHATMTAYKYTGTAPIGKDRSDPEAVLDSDLRVLGVNRLRVIDGSVFQLKYAAENDALCRILGEMGADIILNYWKHN